MNIGEAMKALEKAGTAQNRKVYARHGVGPQQFGVSYAFIRALAKKLRTDHPLAEALWATGNHDARVLATMIADPGAASPGLLERWVEDLDNYVLTDAFSVYAVRTPHGRDLARRWAGDDREWVGAAGWNLIGLLAMEDGEVPDAEFEAHLATIEKEIHSRKNRVRHAMNGAVIAIGIRNEKLLRRALAAAARIGKVEVDHGETGCKTPDAADYIARAVEHRKVRGGGDGRPAPAASGKAGRTAGRAASASAAARAGAAGGARGARSGEAARSGAAARSARGGRAGRGRAARARRG